MRGFMVIPGVVCAVLSRAAAEPINLTINPALSFADFNLCVVGTCDSDASAIAGNIEIDLNSVSSPTQMSLLDYEFILTENLAFNINIFLGAISVNANNIDLMYPTPGVPYGPAAVADGHFTLFDVPAEAAGSASYNATGLVCVFVNAAGLECIDQIDLATIGEVTADSIMGMVSINGNQVTLIINATISIPILPDNPDLAQLDFMGSIVATGVIPVSVPGDFDGDGDADVFDYGAYVACETGPGGGILIEPCRVFDFDDDEDVDLIDLGEFQVAFTGF